MYCILLFSGYLNSSLLASGLPSLNKISNSNSNVHSFVAFGRRCGIESRTCQDVVNDTSETTQECNPEKQSTNGEKSVDSRLVMLSTCQRKRLQNETSAKRTSRLERLIQNQRQRLENESEEQRSARLGRLSESQARRLVNESEEQRSARLGRLSDSQARRLANESEEQRSARLGRLTDSQAQRLACK